MIRQLLVSLALITGLSAQDKAPEIAKISEAFGHLVGKNLETIGVDLDLQLVVKGLQDAASGKDSPLSESECIELLASARERAFRRKSVENLALAEAFLKKNAKDRAIVCLEEGKIQYRVEKEGEGVIIKEEATPAIKYVGKYLDGSVFGRSEEEEVISLEETIPGFRKGLIGMKEGEKRTLYIHPDCGYGTKNYLKPNSLLTFEIELVKANGEQEMSDDALILEGSTASSIDQLDSPQLR
jgi:peptidylprolyl isomerase